MNLSFCSVITKPVTLLSGHDIMVMIGMHGKVEKIYIDLMMGISDNP